MTNVYLKQLCHSLIARFLAVSPRNTSERSAVNWIEVMSHIEQGIIEEFAPQGDGAGWYSSLIWNTNRQGWTKVDNKLHGPSDVSGNYENWLAEPVSNRWNFDNYSIDRRVTGSNDDPTSDGKYIYYDSGQFFRANRGTHHFSNYHWKKHSYHYPEESGPMPFLTVVEMDMLKAEALMRTGGSKTEVAELINKTRVGIGEMPPLTGNEPDSEIWKWLFYEKRIETLGTASGLEWFDIRGCYDLFDPWFDFVDGTLEHFPIPGSELEIMNMDNYTFGGVDDIICDCPSVKPGTIDHNYIQAVKKMQEEAILYNKNIGKVKK